MQDFVDGLVEFVLCCVLTDLGQDASHLAHVGSKFWGSCGRRRHLVGLYRGDKGSSMRTTTKTKIIWNVESSGLSEGLR